MEKPEGQEVSVSEKNEGEVSFDDLRRALDRIFEGQDVPPTIAAGKERVDGELAQLEKSAETDGLNDAAELAAIDLNAGTEEAKRKLKAAVEPILGGNESKPQKPYEDMDDEEKANYVAHLEAEENKREVSKKSNDLVEQAAARLGPKMKIEAEKSKIEASVEEAARIEADKQTVFQGEKYLKESKEAAKVEAENRPEQAAKIESQPKLEFLNSRNQTLFESLTGRAKEIAGEMFSRVKMETADRISLARNRRLYENSDRRMTELEQGLTGERAALAAGQDKLTRFDEALKAVESRSGGAVSEKVRKEAERERGSLEKEIKRTVDWINNTESELKAQSEARERFESRVNNTAERVGNFIEKKLRPHQEKKKILENKSEELGKEISAFKEKISDYEREVGEIQQKMESPDTFGFERRHLKGQIKEIKKQIKFCRQEATAREPEAADLEMELNVVWQKISRWERKKEKYLGYKPEVNESARQAQAERISGLGGVSADYASMPEAGEYQEKEISGDRYIGEWNRHFGRELKLSRGNLGRDAGEKKLSDWERALKRYYRGLDEQRKLSNRELNKKISFIRSNLERSQL